MKEGVSEPSSDEDGPSKRRVMKYPPQDFDDREKRDSGFDTLRNSEFDECAIFLGLGLMHFVCVGGCLCV